MKVPVFFVAGVLIRMSKRVVAAMLAMAAVVAVLSLVPSAGPTSLVSVVGVAEAAGEGAQAPTAAKPWDPPRTADGQPDLQGFWRPELGGSYSIEDVDLQGIQQLRGVPLKRGASRIVDPADGKVPYQPWAAAKQKEIFDNHLNPKPEHLDPQTRCYLTGSPRDMYRLNTYQILQPPGQVVILYENAHAYRAIPLDGRAHIGKSIQLWAGDSRGRWEGNTLVIDATNFNGKSWFDIVGNFQSDALHVVERFTRVAADKINYEATIEDPKLYTRPWKLAVPIVRVDDKAYEMWEEACHEGERDVQYLLRH
jgi:hypothetical protein